MNVMLISLGFAALREFLSFVQKRADLKDASMETVLAEWAKVSAEGKRVNDEWDALHAQPPAPDA